MSWMLWWKLVLVVSLIGFGILAVVATVGGLFDIRRMLRALERGGEQGERPERGREGRSKG